MEPDDGVTPGEIWVRGYRCRCGNVWDATATCGTPSVLRFVPRVEVRVGIRPTNGDERIRNNQMVNDVTDLARLTRTGRN